MLVAVVDCSLSVLVQRIVMRGHDDSLLYSSDDCGARVFAAMMLQ
jgi:hypothetical protein